MIELLLSIALIILGVYIIKTSLGAVIKISICIILISMILSILR
jgi:hypothetical protein